MIIQKFENNPILKETEFKALWTNSFDLDNLTLRDVYMISQMDNPERMLPIGTKIPAKDYCGYDNPWIVVHYGEAAVYDEETMTTKTQEGFYLQQEYHCGKDGNTFGATTNGSYNLKDQYEGFRVVSDATEGNEYMALYSTSYHRGQKMWIPNLAQVQGNNADCFSYYTDQNTYVYRIACRLSDDKNSVKTSQNNITVAINGKRTTFAYVSAYNWSSISVGNNTIDGTWSPRIRFCCFIKGKDIEEGEV